MRQGLHSRSRGCIDAEGAAYMQQGLQCHICSRGVAAQIWQWLHVCSRGFIYAAGAASMQVRGPKLSE